MICVARISVCRPLVVVTSGAANSSVPWPLLQGMKHNLEIGIGQDAGNGGNGRTCTGTVETAGQTLHCSWNGRAVEQYLPGNVGFQERSRSIMGLHYTYRHCRQPQQQNLPPC